MYSVDGIEEMTEFRYVHEYLFHVAEHNKILSKDIKLIKLNLDRDKMIWGGGN